MKEIGKDVKPLDFVDITLEFEAPKTPGTFCAFYKLTYGKSKYIGRKVWCDIIANEAEDDLARLQREMSSFSIQPVENPKPVMQQPQY